MAPLAISNAVVRLAVVTIVVVVSMATVVLAVVAAVPKCTIIEVSAHGCGGKNLCLGLIPRGWRERLFSRKRDTFAIKIKLKYNCESVTFSYY